MNFDTINALRMERQYLTRPLGESELTAYKALYQDLQPGQNVYWNGFGEPPTNSYRTEFDDKEYNRARQQSRELVKGRFQGGNLGWIMSEDIELFTALYRKPLTKPTELQYEILTIIEREGPLDIPLLKEMVELPAKKITPILSRLQQAFLIYEDQHDFNWNEMDSMSGMSRDWYQFHEIFPDVNIEKYTRHEALVIILQRFAYRQVYFDVTMAKSFYKLPEKEIKKAILEMVEKGVLVAFEAGYLLKTDAELLETYAPEKPHFVYAMHRNDFLVKSHDHWLQEKYTHELHDTLYYLLVDGHFCGFAVGKFRWYETEIEDIIVDLPADEIRTRKNEIIKSVQELAGVKAVVRRYCGKEL